MESVKAMRRSRSAQNDFVKNGVENLIYLACGVLVSRGAVLGTLAPFGASYAAAVPKKRLLASLIGTAFGYVILNPTDSFRYIAVVIAIGGVRWLMSDLQKINKSRLFAPLAAMIPILATGVALLFGSSSTLSDFSSCIIEAVLAAAAAYFMSVSVRLAGDKRGITAFTGAETACLVMTGCVMMLSLGSIAIENVSFGRILAVIAVLLCARYGSVSGGAVSGVATGAVFSLAGYEQGFICGGYAFGGLMAGLFSQLGKLGCALAFVVSDFLMSLAFGRGDMPAAVLIESIAGAAIFMFLPKEIGNFVTPIFAGGQTESLTETLRKNIIMRLDFASKAIRNVRSDVEKVSEKLGEMYSPSFNSVCDGVASEVCSGCGMKMYCYEHESGVTRDDFFRLEEYLAAKRKIDEKDVEDAFVKSCCKKGEIAVSMNKNYRYLVASREAQRRVAEIRSVVAGQFSGVSDILGDLSDEFQNTLRCDNDAAERIIQATSGLGAMPVECVCLLSDSGKMSVELVLSAKGERLKKGQLAREISRCCGRRFDLPSISDEGNKIRVAMCEMPLYDVEIGSDQHIANGGKLCGDCIDYFNDGFGSTYALVCDGMGTGGRAAVDGNMAVNVMGRLLRSGLTADSSLQIVNSALMVKSEDESLSTIDLTGIDLYTGRVTLKKAGAPMTFIKKGGRVLTREMPSLPAGILNNIQFSSDSIHLSSGDMVVMVSDGVVTGDEKWLEKLIKSWNRGSAQELAQAVVEEAIRRRSDTKDDDITAVAMRIVENE